MKVGSKGFNKKLKRRIMLSRVFLLIFLINVVINPFLINKAYAGLGEVTNGLDVFEFDSEGNCKTNIQDGDIWLANWNSTYDVSADKAVELMTKNGRIMDLFFDFFKMDEVQYSDDYKAHISFHGKVDDDVRKYSNLDFSEESINNAYMEPKLASVGDDVSLDINNKEFFDTGEGYCWYKLLENNITKTYTLEDGSTDTITSKYYVVREVSRGQDSKFTIDDFDKKDKGAYICTSIKEGVAHKLAAAYNVCEESKLEVKPISEDTYAKKGGSALIGVKIFDTMYDYEGTYQDTLENKCTFTWYKDGVKTKWFRRTYLFDEVKESDYGMYTVVVKENEFETSVSFNLKEMTDDTLTNEVINKARKWSTYVNVLGTEGEFKDRIVNNTYQLNSAIKDYKIWAYVSDNSDPNCELEIPNYAGNEANTSLICWPNIADDEVGLYGGNKVIKCFGIPEHIIKNDTTYQSYSTKVINGTEEERIEYAKKLREYELNHLIKEATSEETFVFGYVGSKLESRVVEVQGDDDYSCVADLLDGHKEYKWKKDGKYIDVDTISNKEFANIMNCGQIIGETYGCPNGDECVANKCDHYELLRTIVYNIIYRGDMRAWPVNEAEAGVGKSTKLKVNAQSSLPITYEWYDDEGNMLGNGAELKINSVTADMFDNTYKCVISDKFAKQEYSFRIKEKTYNEVSPSFYKITRKGNCVELRWTPAKEAVGYRLYIWDGVNKKYNVIHKNLKTNYYNFTGLKSGTEYKFVVKAYTVYDGNVYWSNKLATINERTLPAKTSKISIAKRYSKSVKLSWKPVTGATGYRVYLYKNGKYEVVAKAHKGTSFTKSALKSKTKYKFAVKAYTIYKGQVLWSDVFTTVNVTTK